MELPLEKLKVWIDGYPWIKTDIYNQILTKYQDFTGTSADGQTVVYLMELSPEYGFSAINLGVPYGQSKEKNELDSLAAAKEEINYNKFRKIFDLTAKNSYVFTVYSTSYVMSSRASEDAVTFAATRFFVLVFEEETQNYIHLCKDAFTESGIELYFNPRL